MNDIFYKIKMRFMAFILGAERFDFWYWERTPLPFGPPSNSQYIDGIKLALRKS